MPHEYTHAEIMAAQHAELVARSSRIPLVDLDEEAHAALIEAIKRNLVIGLYTVGPEQEWRVELNHFGKQPICPPGHDPRKSLEWWGQHYPLILAWPYPQSDGSDDDDGGAA